MEATHGWERNKAQTRLALVRAAVELFRSRGYEATTADDIASAAGCSRRTFFRYFEGKEDVLFVDTARLLADFRAMVREPRPGMTRWEQVRLGLLTAVRSISEPSSAIEDLTIASWLNEQAIAQRFNVIMGEMEHSVAQALAEEAGVDPDRDLATQLMARSTTAACTAAMHVHVSTGEDLAGLIERVFDMLEHRAGPAVAVAPIADRAASG